VKNFLILKLKFELRIVLLFSLEVVRYNYERNNGIKTAQKRWIDG